MDHPSPKKTLIRFIDSWASVHFDLLRGLAAFLVLFGHWRNLLFADFTHIDTHRWMLALPYALAGSGHQSVVLFFVLSGYFIGGTVLRSLERGQWEWRGYLLRRAVRLWTVLVPALLLCAFWDHLGIHLGYAPALYGGNVQNHILSVNVALLLPLKTFFGNLVFVQNILVPTFGSDGALWSLANEFWYYILFPLGTIAVWRTTRLVPRLMCAVLFLVVARFVGTPILLSFPLWLAGVLLFKLPVLSVSPRMGRYLRIAASVVYAPIFFSLGHLSSVSQWISDCILPVATFFFLWVFLLDTRRYDPEARGVRISREFARFSYTLYAVHLPFLVFFTALLVKDTRWYPTPIHLLYGVILLLVTLLYAYVLALFTEFRTDALRAWLEKLFGMHRTAPALPSNPLSKPAGH